MTARKKAALAATLIITGFPAWGLLFIVAGVGLEFWTISNDYPISWLLYDAPRMSVFLATAALVSWVWFQILVIVGLAIHAYFPAKSRWPRQDRMIERFGDPRTHTTAKNAVAHATQLWRVHIGEANK